jgi:hypothetical protein
MTIALLGLIEFGKSHYGSIRIGSSIATFSNFRVQWSDGVHAVFVMIGITADISYVYFALAQIRWRLIDHPTLEALASCTA